LNRASPAAFAHHELQISIVARVIVLELENG